jgi:hypothetical protein
MAKAPTEIRSLARSHTETAINTLVGIMNKDSAPEASRVAAANSLLDRGWGKPSQPLVGGDEDDPAIKTVTRIELVGVRPSDKDT